MARKKKSNCLILAGVREDLSRGIRAGLEGRSSILSIEPDDTLGIETLRGADMILFDLRQGEYLAQRIVNTFLEAQATITSEVHYIADMAPSEELRNRMANMRPLSLPIDFSYLVGVIDSANSHRERLMTLTREQDHISQLYNVSSELLKVRSRKHVHEALNGTLTKIVSSEQILLCFPESNEPILYYFVGDGIGPNHINALRNHLEEAWGYLRPESSVDWEWVNDLAVSHHPPRTAKPKSGDFLSVPINRGHQTDGFLTLFTDGGELDEHTHQSVMLISELIGVLMTNLYLKEELERRATRDGLTGLHNRQTLFDILEKECQRSKRYGHPFSVVMFDLDHFKSVNDTYMHQGGDEALRHVSRIVTQSIREVDVAGRCGGEEFIVILPYTDLAGARIWAERLRERLASTPVNFEGKTFTVTASVGVACTSGDVSDPDAIVALADAALYKAKETGRNRVLASLPQGKFVTHEGEAFP